MSNIVVGIIAGSIVALISFIFGLFGQIWYGKYQEKRQKQKEALKNHFSDLEEYTIKPLIESLEDTHNRRGYILYVNRAKQDINVNKTDWPIRIDSDKFLEFKSHFSNQANKITALINSAHNHNREQESFDAQLIRCLRERVCKNELVYEGVASQVLRYGLHAIYMEGIEKLEDVKNTLNFETVEIENNIWRVRSSMGHFAEVPTEEEALEIIEEVPKIITESTLLNKMKDIIINTETLLEKVKELVSTSKFIIEQYTKYGYLLKRKNSCTTCKLIFEEHST